MDGLSLFFVIISYAAIAIFLIGFLAKVWKYAMTPAPLKIPVTPAPTNSPGVVWRMLQEVVVFKSLFKSKKVIWVAGYVFHLALAFLLIKHLRFFFVSTPEWLDTIATYDLYVGYILVAALAFLFILRLAVDRTFYITVMTDYVLLLLLGAIAITGIISTHLVGFQVLGVKEYIMGLVSFSPVEIPRSGIFIAHFSLVLVLLVYFPFSKLMHAGGLFFSPTRNQVDNARDKRWVTPWAVSEREE